MVMMLVVMMVMVMRRARWLRDIVSEMPCTQFRRVRSRSDETAWRFDAAGSRLSAGVRTQHS